MCGGGGVVYLFVSFFNESQYYLKDFKGILLF